MNKVQADLAIYDHLLPGPFVEAAYEVFRELVIPPSIFFFPLSLLKEDCAVASLDPYLPRAAAAYVARHLSLLLTLCPTDVVHGADGFEFWVGITARGGDKAYLHIDHDEMQRRSGQGLRFPSIASIFHLGPSSGLDGGQTLFDLGVAETDASERFFRLSTWTSLVEACSAPLIVPQRQGRLVVFRGHLPHAVEPIKHCDPHAPRVALLANLWQQRLSSVPTGVSSLTPEEYSPLRQQL